MGGQETMNEIELVRTRYEVATVDWGYHVYVAVSEATVGLILPCEREVGNIHDLYAIIVVDNNDTPIDNDALVLNENFRG